MATESVWLSPRAALAQYWQGQIELAPPQIMSLVQLARQRPPPVIAPETFDGDGTRVISAGANALDLPQQAV